MGRLLFRLTNANRATRPIAARLSPAGSGVIAASLIVSVIVPVSFERYSKPAAVSNGPMKLTVELPSVVGGPNPPVYTSNAPWLSPGPPTPTLQVNGGGPPKVAKGVPNSKHPSGETEPAVIVQVFVPSVTTNAVKSGRGPDGTNPGSTSEKEKLSIGPLVAT